MRRTIVEPTRTATAMRVASLLLIALGVLWIALHHPARKDGPTAAITDAGLVLP